MESRLQHILLKRATHSTPTCDERASRDSSGLNFIVTRFSEIRSKFAKAVVLVVCAAAITNIPNTVADPLSIDSEFFELGVNTGILDVEDFTSEITVGLYANFRATENFFLQSNFFQTDVSYSSVEKGPQGPFTGDRQYRHFNLLLGYNLFQGEIFKGKHVGLSSFYLLGGVGDTEFMDESNFTYVYGFGYQMALSRRLNLRIDYQNYQYDSIVIDQLENTVNNSHFFVGVSWLF